MNFVITLAILMTLSNANSSPGKTPSPAAVKSRFIYLEFYPNTKKKVTLQSIKCDTKKNELSVKKFSSTSKVTKGEVNVLNIYARSSDCKESPHSSVWHESIELPKNGKHTHVYITILSETISVL